MQINKQTVAQRREALGYPKRGPDPALTDDLGAKASRIYQVEVILAVSTSHPKWSSVYYYVFFDRKAKKRLYLSKPKLFEGRVNTDGCGFWKKAPALALCGYLNKNCTFGAKSSHSGYHLDKEDDTRERIKARVVEINTAVSRELVT